MTDNNEWELTSGLALDGATVEVTACEFGYNANIGAGIVCANFTFTDTSSGEDIEQSFSVGDGWETSRDGSELVSENGKPKKLGKNSNYGRLIASAIELVGDPSLLGGSPKDARIWLHTMWRMGTVKVMVRNPTTNVEKESDKFVFKAWLGHSVNKGGAASAASASATGAANGAKPAASSNGIPADISEELWSTLLGLAREASDHDAFLEAALEVDGVDGNKAAQKACMGTKAGSVWAARSAA